jgi:hypothetical protein
VPVGPLGRGAPARLDDHEGGAAAPRALDEGPDVDIRRHEVGAPGDDEVRLLDALRVGPADAAARRVPARLGAGIAHGARDEPRGAQRVEEPQEKPAVDLPLVRAIAVAEDALRPVFLDDGLPPHEDLVESLLPRDGCEAPFALGAGAAQRREDAIGRDEQLVLAIDLGAREAGREGMLGIALDFHDAVAVHLGEQGALVRAIVRAHGADGLDHRVANCGRWASYAQPTYERPRVDHPATAISYDREPPTDCSPDPGAAHQDLRSGRRDLPAG